jgi:uncharacterized protein
MSDRPGGASPIRLGTLSPAEALEKEALLLENLRGMGRTLVAYSGGVDSAYLLAAAHRALGSDALGVIAASESLPASELADALAVASNRDIPVRVVETREMEREGYRRNGSDRCYHCKTELFEQLGDLAVTEGWRTIAYGAVTDDLGDDRPGMNAAREFEIKAPLLDAGLSKLEVRLLARRMGLRVWDKPQSACLASRIPHGHEVTPEKLRQVGEAEAWIRRRFGIRVVRVRHWGETARVESDRGDVPALTAALDELRSELSQWGFLSVEIDPEGYRRADPLPVDNTEVNDHVHRG